MKAVLSKKFIITIFCYFITIPCITLTQATCANTEKDLKDMKNFETEIAYFYGATNPSAVAEHYIKAISLMNTRPDRKQKEAVIGHLTAAYTEVANQTKLVFDTQKAAKYEYNLIQAHAEKKSFEEIYTIMVNLYKTVFGLHDPQIKKAAMLRTFLYQYKTRFATFGELLSPEDQSLMIAIARASERELNQLLPRP